MRMVRIFVPFATHSTHFTLSSHILVFLNCLKRGISVVGHPKLVVHLLGLIGCSTCLFGAWRTYTGQFQGWRIPIVNTGVLFARSWQTSVMALDCGGIGRLSTSGTNPLLVNVARIWHTNVPFQLITSLLTALRCNYSSCFEIEMSWSATSNTNAIEVFLFN